MNKLYKHVKSGHLYEVLHEGFLESNVTPVVIYRSFMTGLIWVRPASEFYDKRFEPYLER